MRVMRSVILTIAVAAIAYLMLAQVVFEFRHPWMTSRECLVYLPRALTWSRVAYSEARPRETLTPITGTETSVSPEVLKARRATRARLARDLLMLKATYGVLDGLDRGKKEKPRLDGGWYVDGWWITEKDLDDMKSAGWIVETDTAHLKITDAGRRQRDLLRQEIELLTAAQ